MRGQPFDWIDRPENLLFTSGRFVGWNFFYSFECNDSSACGCYCVSQSRSNSGEDGEEPHNERGTPILHLGKRTRGNWKR